MYRIFREEHRRDRRMIGWLVMVAVLVLAIALIQNHYNNGLRGCIQNHQTTNASGVAYHQYLCPGGVTRYTR